MITVIITWMDGQQETYRCEDFRVADGVLYLTQRMYSSEPKRAIPLGNVRIWLTEG